MKCPNCGGKLLWRNGNCPDCYRYATKAQADLAHRFMLKWTGIILAIAFVGTALLIWWGSQPETEEWASYATRAAGPSIEIIP